MIICALLNVIIYPLFFFYRVQWKQPGHGVLDQTRGVGLIKNVLNFDCRLIFLLGMILQVLISLGFYRQDQSSPCPAPTTFNQGKGMKIMRNQILDMYCGTFSSAIYGQVLLAEGLGQYLHVLHIYCGFPFIGKPLLTFSISQLLQSWSIRFELSQEDIWLQHVGVCAEIGKKCIDHNPTDRPDTFFVIQKLDEVQRMCGCIETDISASLATQVSLIIPHSKFNHTTYSTCSRMVYVVVPQGCFMITFNKNCKLLKFTANLNLFC